MYLAYFVLQGGSSLGDSKHLRLLNGLDYVLTYEDKDGDWMLVGDVPWRYIIILHSLILP